MVVVGAGAAGLAAAIFAARRLPQCHIVALDGARKLGAKILISGGGRCNLTNERVEAGDFWGGSRNTIKQILAAFPANKAVEFFRQLGVETHVEGNGKIFPNSESARAVVAALLEECRRLGVTLLTDHRVQRCARQDDHYSIDSSHGAIPARAVVLATGGLSFPKTGSDGGGYGIAQSLGHTLVPTTPALAPLVLDSDFHVQLSGVSLDVELAVEVEGEKPLKHAGSMLWTHFGVSGPAAMDVSRHWHRARLADKQVAIFANFLPGIRAQQVDERLIGLGSEHPKASLEHALALCIPARLSAAVLTKMGVEGKTVMAHLSREIRHKVAEALTRWPLPVRDSRGYNFAEVTAGGIPLREIDPTTMQSRVCPGLFLVGEILDVDGRIGGFNFQWAWSSGYVAGVGLEKHFEH